MQADDVIARCREEELAMVRLLWVDNAGVERGRVIDAADVAAALESGANIAQAQQAFSVLEYPAADAPFDAVGEVRLLPDPDTFRVLPYADRTAAMLCDMQTLDREPWDADPRSTLAAFLDSFEYTPAAAFESEFYLVRETEDGTLQPFDDSGCFTADGMQNAHEVVLDMVDALNAQGQELSVYYPEYGPGQQELVVGHTTGMTAPDEYAFYRRTVKAVARRHGLRATFVPKPFPDGPGSGCHVHLSLWEDDDNVFFDPDADSAYGITETARSFVAGVLDHAPGLVALTAPSVISYKRLQPHSWASAYTAWGFDNREAMVRIPSSQWEERSKTTRIEVKAADNTMNPHIALLGILAAGRDGVERGLDPGEPVDVDPASLSRAEREERGIERLPETLGEALDALESDDVLREAVGGDLYESYLAAKRATWRDFTATATEWDVENYTRQF